ncbi:MAG: hypothetical protein ACI3W6_06950 [Clostridia bacterium]
MSLTSFFQRLFHRSPDKVSSEEMLWTELKVPEDMEPIDKKILNAFAGKADPLRGEEALAEFLDCGWERIKNEVYAFAVGKKNCLPTYFKRILDAYPEESFKLLECCFGEMSPERRLLYLSLRGKDNPRMVSDEVRKILPELEPEELSMAFSVLTAIPSAEGEELVCSYLEKDDWRLKMKAASALREMKAVHCVPRIRKAAESCDDTVGAGLNAIADEMEKEQTDD